MLFKKESKYYNLFIIRKLNRAKCQNRRKLTKIKIAKIRLNTNLTFRMNGKKFNNKFIKILELKTKNIKCLKTILFKVVKIRKLLLIKKSKNSKKFKKHNK